MKDKPTLTFRLTDDFYNKLDLYVKKLIDDGFEIFKEDFKNIDTFYCAAMQDTSNRDDHEFRRVPKSIYLAEAIYYKIMDEFNREAFNKTKDTVIILPDCLSLMRDKCKRERTRYGKVCAQCVPNCQINKIMEIARPYGVEAYFSKRALEKQLTKIKKAKPSLSVIGISCMLTLPSGMRTAKELGIPARGVFLNFTGCDHWTSEPFTTETAVDRVKTILEEKYAVLDSTS